MGLLAVDLAIQNGIDFDGTLILKILDLNNRIMDVENKKESSWFKKLTRNRWVNALSKHFD